MPSPRSGDERLASPAGFPSQVRAGDAVFAAALALASYFAISSFALADRDPQSSSEGQFLALWAAAVIGSIAVWGGRSASWIGLTTAFATTTVIWAVGTGYLRGAVIGAILTSAVAVTAVSLFGRRERWLALSFGSQFLIRSDLALAPLDSLELAIHWLGLPLIVGFCLEQLARRYGNDRVLVAALVGIILGPGWTVSVAAGVVALAGGCLLGSSDVSRERWLGAFLLMIVALRGPGAGVLPLLGGLTLVIRGRSRLLLVVAGVAVAIAGFENKSHWLVLSDALLASALVPVALLAPRAIGSAAALLVVAAATLSYDQGTMAVGSMLLALFGPTGNATAVLQRWWSSCLAVLVAVASAYPWVRTAPQSDVRKLLGLVHPLVFLAIALIMVVALGSLVDRSRARVWSESIAAIAAMMALAVALAPYRVEILERPLEERPTIVDLEIRRYRHRVVTDELVRTVVIDTAVTNGVGVPRKTLVGRLKVLDPEHQELASASLRMGLNVTDWSLAGRRSPTENTRPGPLHWMAFVPPRSAGLGYRYRVRLDLPEPSRIGTVEILAARGLGPKARLVVYRMELRR